METDADGSLKTKTCSSRACAPKAGSHLISRLLIEGGSGPQRRRIDFDINQLVEQPRMIVWNRDWGERPEATCGRAASRESQEQEDSPRSGHSVACRSARHGKGLAPTVPGLACKAQSQKVDRDGEHDDLRF